MTFLMIYGVAPLDVTNDRWIMTGYDETDIIAHYAGWEAYRDSDWAFPLAYTDNLAKGDGVIISYLDSLPWIAIIFKLMNPFLPNTFQYFGIYTLLCYILQAIAGFLIIRFKTKSPLFSLCGTVLFSFAPVLIERSLRHTGLGSQWLILFAIYIYFIHRERNKFSYLDYGVMCLLQILSIGIHPYFLPMICCFTLLCVVNDIKRKQCVGIALFGISLMATYAMGYIIGVLGHGVNVSRDGYGFYSMNLNSLYNPTSTGGYNWSAIFKVHPQILGNYDGFNYLGAGVFVLFAFLFTSLIFLDKKVKTLMVVRIDSSLVVISVCLFLFAISNVITFNDKVILNVPLPQFLLSFCGIFRASSRLFYPVYYLIIIQGINMLWKCKEYLSVSRVYGMLILIVFVQLFDIKSCIYQKHINMIKNSSELSVLDDKVLQSVGKNSEGLLAEEGATDIRNIVVWALKNNMDVYPACANSGVYEKSFELTQRNLDKIRSTGEIKDFVVVTSNPEVLKLYNSFPRTASYKYDNTYIIFKSGKGGYYNKIIS